MQAQYARLNLLGGLLVAAFPMLAAAWNPYPDLVNPQNPPPVTYRSRPTAPRIYMPTHPATLQPAATPAPVYQPAPAAVSYAPPPAPPARVPVYNPPPQPAYTPPPAPAYQPPVYRAPAPAVAAAAPYTPPPRPAPAPYVPPPLVSDDDEARVHYADEVTMHDQATLGLEAFYDNYREPSLDLDSHAYYAALTGDYQYYMDSPWFVGLDGRVSYGSDHYHSPSGTADGIPQWEFETRARTGFSVVLENGRLDPFIGIGLRYYRDEFSGKKTDTGASGYDRRIFQLYVPVGMSYQFEASGWSWKPALEYDRLFYGNVSSHLADVGPTYDNIENRQTSGYGLRAELMMGIAGEKNFEFGPFIRYWDIDESKVTTDSSSRQWIEPKNTRLQMGASLRYMF